MNILIAISLGMLTIGALMGALLPQMWRSAQRKGKVLVEFVDSDTRRYKQQWIRPPLTMKGPDGLVRDFPLDGRAEWSGVNAPRKYVVESVAGWSLIPPPAKNGILPRLFAPRPRADVINSSLTMWFLSVSDPALIHEERRTNKLKQGFRANDPDDREGWIKTAIIVVGVIMVVGFVGLGALVYNVTRAVGGGAG